LSVAKHPKQLILDNTMPQLTIVNLRGTSVSKAGVKQLKAALPDCKIEH
jgi:hypothetical protein